jgi:hypothetical protein
VVALSADFCIAEAFRLIGESAKVDDTAQRLRLLQGASAWLQVAQNWTAGRHDLSGQCLRRLSDIGDPDRVTIPPG